MEKLLELVMKNCEKAEVYRHEREIKSVIFKNSQLHGIETKLQSGVSIRLIKGGKIGFAYTRNLNHPQELLQNALNSIEAGVVASYDFPVTKEISTLPTFDNSIENVESCSLVEECQRICKIIGKIGAESFAFAGVCCDRVRVINSTGTDVASKSGVATVYAGAGFPGGGTSIGRVRQDTEFKPMTAAMLDEVASLFNAANRTLKIESGRMPVLFMPNAVYSLNWRLSAAANARNIYEKTSPLTSRVGEKVLSEKITLFDDPHDNSDCSARCFDDEGVATGRMMLFEKGVFTNFFSDLNYAEKLNVKPSGHGYRTALWGGDSITLSPVPEAMHLRFVPGQKSVKDLIASMKRGIILESCLGAHSGNILNGDLSLGGCPALYVENGEIQGRVDNVMLAGNIYEMFNKVIDLSNTPEIGYQSFTPAILFDDIKVSGSK